MDIKGFKNLLFTKAKNEGFSEYEIYYSEKKSFSVNIYKKQIEKYQNSETSGFGFRGIYNGKMGYYYSETIDESIIPEVIATAKINAELLENDEKEFIFEGNSEYPKRVWLSNRLLHPMPICKSKNRQLITMINELHL